MNSEQTNYKSTAAKLPKLALFLLDQNENNLVGFKDTKPILNLPPTAANMNKSVPSDALCSRDTTII